VNSSKCYLKSSKLKNAEQQITMIVTLALYTFVYTQNEQRAS